MCEINDERPLTVRALLAASRRSLPATVYLPDADGVLRVSHTRPARLPTQAGRLTDEQRMAVLLKTGHFPGTLPPEAQCGVQFCDLDLHGQASKRDTITRLSLNAAGIMSGHGDPNTA